MENTDPIRLGFIGGGTMAEAIMGGVIDKQLLSPDAVFVTDIREERRQYLSENTRANVAADNATVMEKANVILFATKPQDLETVLGEIAPRARPDQVFLSICAGKRTATIEEGLETEKNPRPRVIRIMPNTPARISMGMAGICKGAHAEEEDVATARKIFQAVGEAEIVAESLMDGVTAIAGSGPAYAFFLMECMVEAGVKAGFDREQAARMVRQTFLGAANLAAQSGKTPEQLRRDVTSPGGTTAAAFDVLEERRVREAIVECVGAAEQRAKELSGP